METTTRRGFFVTIGGIVLTTTLEGCGGGSPSTKSRSAPSRVSVTVAWPERSRKGRYIPLYAESLTLELRRKETTAVLETLTLNRPTDKPASQTAAFAPLTQPGTFVLTGRAWTDREGAGTIVAQATLEVILQGGDLAQPILTLASVIGSLEIQGQPLRIAPGQSLVISGRARDAQGNTLLLPPSALSWSLVSGGDLGRLMSSGTQTSFAATALGTARVRLAEEGAEIAVEADITIALTPTPTPSPTPMPTPSPTPTPPPSFPNPGGPTGIWSKFAGNMLNTRRVLSGLTSIDKLLWATRIPGLTGALCPLIVDAAGQVYVSGKEVGLTTALSPTTGAISWSVTSSGRVNGLLSGEGNFLYATGAIGTLALSRTTGLTVTKIDSGNIELPPSAVPGGNLVVVPPSAPPVLQTYGAGLVAGWQVANLGTIPFAPAVGTTRRVYITAQGASATLTGLNGDTGAEEFRVTPSGVTAWLGSPVVTPGETQLFIGAATTTGDQLQAYSAVDGSLLWSAPAPGIRHIGLAEYGLYTLSSTTLSLRDRFSGGIEWEAFADFHTQAGLVVMGFPGSAVVVRQSASGNSQVVAYSNGDELSVYTLVGKAVAGELAGDEEVIYVGCTDGTILKLGA